MATIVEEEAAKNVLLQQMPRHAVDAPLQYAREAFATNIMTGRHQ